MSLLKLSLLSFALILLALDAQAGELKGVIRNNQGVRRYDSGRPMDSYDLFTDALGEIPYAPEVQYNVGNAFLQMKETEKAIKQFETAIRLAPGQSEREKEVRFRSLFNMGVVLAAQEKREEALTLYQKALGIRPDSIETKTNMELLLGQGGGGGKGDKEDKEKKEGDGEGEQQQPKKFENQPQKPQPQPYKGKDLSKQDVDRILDELKQQEEQIRAKQQREGAKDAPPDKDW